MNGDKTLPRVLIVDDNDEIRGLIKIGLPLYRPPFCVEFASTAAEACHKLTENCFDALVLDVNLLGPTGVTVAAEAHVKCPAMPKVFFTAYDKSVTHEHAAEFKMDVWSKPMNVAELFERIEGLLASRANAAAAGASGPLSVPPVLSAVAACFMSAALGR